ncbi:hypothetical protein FQA47_007311 [Oryzias melastigma]|uniref:Uncharacterized protein n=1 Tax=Oryzias melastigma TaxID=30732 RepID=A0A834EZZ9_ORYME|nr:hypothetical protein FQA47_007311 [Oryzias melastigma]
MWSLAEKSRVTFCHCKKRSGGVIPSGLRLPRLAFAPQHQKQHLCTAEEEEEEVEEKEEEEEVEHPAFYMGLGDLLQGPKSSPEGLWKPDLPLVEKGEGSASILSAPSWPLLQFIPPSSPPITICLLLSALL